jgi:hypothetical protein
MAVDFLRQEIIFFKNQILNPKDFNQWEDNLCTNYIFGRLCDPEIFQEPNILLRSFTEHRILNCSFSMNIGCDEVGLLYYPVGGNA